jgi:hypothetical protein
VSDPAQQAAARAALAEASREFWLEPRDFVVYEVVRRRRANTKTVFYRVGLVQTNGVRHIYLVSDDGAKVVRRGLIPPPFPAPLPVVLANAQEPQW